MKSGVLSASGGSARTGAPLSTGYNSDLHFDPFSASEEEDDWIKKMPDNRRDSVYSSAPENKHITLGDFKIKKVIGRGTYGKVFLIEQMDKEKMPTGEVYAMKSLDKEQIINSETYSGVKLEKEVMERINHPFLVGLMYIFQTENKILFVMPFI